MGLNIETSKKAKSNNNMSWIGAGLGAASSAIGMIGQRARERRANKQNEKLMDMQHKNQKDLNQQGQELSMDMWNKTNYGAQMEHMKEAGINPALMYGQGGGGGTTANSGSGGSAAMGSAAQPQMMDISALDGMMKMAQVELMKSQSKKFDAEAETERGDNARGKGELSKMLEEELLTAAKGETEYWNMEGSRMKYKRDFEGYLVDKMETDLKEATFEAEKAGIVAEALGKQIDVELKRANVTLTEEQTRKIYHEIIQNYIKSGAAAVGSLGLVVSNAIKAVTGGGK